MRIKSITQNLLENWPIKILSLIGAILVFLFYRMSNFEERELTLPLKIYVSDTLAPSGNYPRYAKVILRGDRESLYDIKGEDLEVYADFRGISEEGRHRAPVLVTRKGAALHVDPLEIRTNPMYVSLILERKISRKVEVFPRFTAPKPGYDPPQYFVNPNTVTVVGPQSRVENIKLVYTELIDISEVTSSFDVRVNLEATDPLISYSGITSVEVHGSVQETVLLKTFNNIDIISLDLAPKFSIKTKLPRGSVKVQGSQLVLEKINPEEEIRLLMDCSQIKEPGIYALDVKPEIPKDLLVLKYEPKQLQIEVYLK